MHRLQPNTALTARLDRGHYAPSYDTTWDVQRLNSSTVHPCGFLETCSTRRSHRLNRCSTYSVCKVASGNRAPCCLDHWTTASSSIQTFVRELPSS
ncbi:hypothetical protein HPB50_007036 [Hyalomma asiaticum]|uniref:Uncharacterized protein n=1 Tax=Hyalomma asiaticum TaxID=266040 RepID=A0ACB7SSJ5_HYAAI|nr:hypothetical protein HPB50_007036 [Hyalomma asiaticum]